MGKQWTLSRGLLAVAAVGLALAATFDAAGNGLRLRVPQLAAHIPGERVADTEVLDFAFLATGKRPPLGPVDRAAHQTLRASPLNATALHLMALARAQRGDEPETLRLAGLAAEVTQRDFPAQLVLINDAVRRRDTRAVLDHYDAALRAQPAVAPLVFPLLKRTLALEGIRVGLARYLAEQSTWAPDFVRLALDDDKTVEQGADIVLRAGTAMPAALRAQLAQVAVTRLIGSRKFAPVDRALALIPGAPRTLLQDARLTGPTTDTRFGLAAWQVMSTPLISASLTPAARAGWQALSIYAAPGANGVVASKVLALPPGIWQLRPGAATGPAVGPGQELRWRMTCVAAGNDTMLWNGGDLLGKAAGGGSITIGRDCPQQRLELVVTVGFERPALELALESPELASPR